MGLILSGCQGRFVKLSQPIFPIGPLLDETAMVTGEDVLPGFTCRVSDLLP
jgi:hypothetical protein